MNLCTERTPFLHRDTGSQMESNDDALSSAMAAWEAFADTTESPSDRQEAAKTLVDIVDANGKTLPDTLANDCAAVARMMIGLVERTIYETRSIEEDIAKLKADIDTEYHSKKPHVTSWRTSTDLLRNLSIPNPIAKFNYDALTAAKGSFKTFSPEDDAYIRALKTLDGTMEKPELSECTGRPKEEAHKRWLYLKKIDKETMKVAEQARMALSARYKRNGDASDALMAHAFVKSQHQSNAEQSIPSHPGQSAADKKSSIGNVDLLAGELSVEHRDTSDLKQGETQSRPEEGTD